MEIKFYFPIKIEKKKIRETLCKIFSLVEGCKKIIFFEDILKKLYFLISIQNTYLNTSLICKNIGFWRLGGTQGFDFLVIYQLSLLFGNARIFRDT